MTRSLGELLEGTGSERSPAESRTARPSAGENDVRFRQHLLYLFGSGVPEGLRVRSPTIACSYGRAGRFRSRGNIPERKVIPAVAIPAAAPTASENALGGDDDVKCEGKGKKREIGDYRHQTAECASSSPPMPMR
jgi:hypothetical protein